MIHPRDSSTNRFPIFKELNPDYSYDSLLDFGGNQGNLLYFSEGKINEEKYTSIDNSFDSLELGRKEFTKADFIFWNRYNEMYNHEGNKNEPLPNLKQHDYIWAYSVFSHMIIEDIIEVLDWMKTINAKRIMTSSGASPCSSCSCSDTFEKDAGRTMSTYSFTAPLSH